MARRPRSVEEGNANPETFAGKSIGQIADHVAEVVSLLDKKPAMIGHSFGGLLTQIVAGRGLAAVSVAVDPAPFRGVLPLPISALRSASVALKSPANRHRAVPLTFEQFRYGFANAVSEEEAQELFVTYAVPGPGEPCSRPPPPTSTHGQKPRWTPRIPNGARYSSFRARRTTPFPGRSPTRLTSTRARTRA